jgi:substrate import-associated zinc metallohydrolase lipoprotein
MKAFIMIKIQKAQARYCNRIISVCMILLLVATSSCYEKEKINNPVFENPESEDEIDQYIHEVYTEEFGVAVRYKYVDRYVDATKRVTPPKRKVVVPMLDFLTSLWVEPFISVPNGENFFRSHVPAEVIFVGSSIYNDDGTITLGTADAGARITLTEVNDIDVNNKAWVLRQLGTIYHEFAHIIHQRYRLPPNWEQISPMGYTSTGSWYNLTDAEALQRGFVSPYATSSYNEDFAEFAAFLLFDENFYDNYINDEANCATAECVLRNEGRARLREKYTAVLNHYKQYTGVDLLQVRAIVQDKLQ